MTDLAERRISGLPVFDLPPELEASSPPEARGLTRDAVRMLVADRRDGSLVDTTFSELPRMLHEGDLVVINTSGTLAAEIPGTDGEGRDVEVHLSTQLPADLWTVELRRSGHPVFDATAGQSVAMPAGGKVVLLAPYASHPAGVRLWVAKVDVPRRLHTYLAEHGRPIRYGYVQGDWPIAAYQNVYVTEPGSAEMPSAGRPFTAQMVTRLVAAGIGVSPIVLHTGVASLEASEPPYPEYYRVSASTASRINQTRYHGGRSSPWGRRWCEHWRRSWTNRAGAPGRRLDRHRLTPDRTVRALDGLLTGWHEPEASHLAMLEAVAGRDLLERSYALALDRGTCGTSSETCIWCCDDRGDRPPRTPLAAMPSTRRAILASLKRHGDREARDLAADVGLTVAAVRQQLLRLDDDGLVTHRRRAEGRGLRPTITS